MFKLSVDTEIYDDFYVAAIFSCGLFEGPMKFRFVAYWKFDFEDFWMSDRDDYRFFDV